MANIFPRWTNWLPLKVVVCAGLTLFAVVAGVWAYFTPKYTRVGYMPNQPVPFSHALHAGQLGMDCRYCHSNVEVSSHANVHSTQTCMGCHSVIQQGNPKLQAVYESWETGKPIEWIRIHQVPDYAYFNHAVHVARGVSCLSCHGQINEMEVVYHDQPQSMGWCLECHRAPENHLRPIDKVYDLDWRPAHEGLDQKELGLRLKQEWHVNPPEDCSACHR
jgi:hypothetical protein